MDIEGWEWDWLESLDSDDLSRVTQMVIEFHFVMNLQNSDMTEAFLKRLKTIEKLNKHFYLMHVHANNWAKMFKYGGQTFPEVIECTFVNKEVYEKNPNLFVTLNVRSFPTELDMRNNRNLPDINDILNTAPFKSSILKLVYLTHDF